MLSNKNTETNITSSSSFIIHVDESSEELDEFENESDRKLFIKKTLSIFLSSIILTFSSCLLFNLNETCKQFATSHIGQYFYLGAFIGTLITSFPVLCCCPQLYSKFPYNFIIYILFVICLSYSLSISTILISSKILIFSIAITTFNTIALTSYAVLTNTDFTQYEHIYIIAIISFCFCLSFNLFFYNLFLEILISTFAAILFNLFIVYDMQMIVGKKHISIKFKKNEYILAAMCLYLDVINLFLYVIQCLLLTEET